MLHVNFVVLPRNILSSPTKGQHTYIFYISFVSIFIPSSRYSLVCSAWFVYKHVNFYYTHSPHPCPAPMISQQELCKNYKTAPLGGTRRGSPHQVTAACIPRLPFICNNLPIRLCGPSRGSQEEEGRLAILLIFIIIYLLSLILNKFQIFNVLLVLLIAP